MSKENQSKENQPENTIDPLFDFHRLNAEGRGKALRIAIGFTLLMEQLQENCPMGTREMSICKTKLEEACFFAKKAMAVQPGNQESLSAEERAFLGK